MKCTDERTKRLILNNDSQYFCCRLSCVIIFHNSPFYEFTSAVLADEYKVCSCFFFFSSSSAWCIFVFVMWTIKILYTRHIRTKHITIYYKIWRSKYSYSLLCTKNYSRILGVFLFFYYYYYFSHSLQSMCGGKEREKDVKIPIDNVIHNKIGPQALQSNRMYDQMHIKYR